MKNSREWFKNIKKDRQKTPEYLAESISIDLAVRITERIDELNMNQKDLAKELNVSKSYISQVLQGKNNMTILTICKIAEALRMRADIGLVKNEISSESSVPLAQQSL